MPGDIFGNYVFTVETAQDYPAFFGLDHGKFGLYGFGTVGDTIRVKAAYHTFHVRGENNLLFLDHLKIADDVDRGVRSDQRDTVEFLDIEFPAFDFHHVLPAF